MPATILSRCQRFTFNRHTVGATAAHLHAIAAEEQIALEAGVAEAIARAATGSMRDALSILDQLMAYGSGTITLEQVRGLLGATEAQEVAALVDALLSADLTGASLRQADLTSARLFRADLSKADLTGARLANADLLHAVLAGATWIDGTTICGPSSIGQCHPAPEPPAVSDAEPSG